MLFAPYFNLIISSRLTFIFSIKQSFVANFIFNDIKSEIGVNRY
jgi:hypothetical protein